MHRADVPSRREGAATGYAHVALALGGRPAVDAAVERLRQEGLTVESVPRVTGDGYYEAVVLDPEGNRIELTA
jgi:lactoylglutathione lyase